MNKIILNLYYDKVSQGMQCIRCKDTFQSDSIEILNNHIVHGGCWDNVLHPKERRLETYNIPWMTLDEAGQWECGCGFISECTKEDAFEHQHQHAKYKLDILSKSKAGFKV
jgi:hypothetical protein